MTPFQPWGWHYRVRAPKWLAAVSLLLLSLHATTSLGLVGLETADFLERADPDRFLINNLNNIGGEEGMTLYDSALIFNNFGLRLFRYRQLKTLLPSNFVCTLSSFSKKQ